MMPSESMPARNVPQRLTPIARVVFRPFPDCIAKLANNGRIFDNVAIA
jgi:hypothetical protein